MPQDPGLDLGNLVDDSIPSLELDLPLDVLDVDAPDSRLLIRRDLVGILGRSLLGVPVGILLGLGLTLSLSSLILTTLSSTLRSAGFPLLGLRNGFRVAGGLVLGYTILT